MNSIGTKLKLTIDEPWDAYQIVVGKIIQQYSKGKKTYFLIEDDSNPRKFIVANRYAGEDVTDVMQEKVIIVAIYSPNSNIALFNDAGILSHLTYNAIGSIELYS